MEIDITDTIGIGLILLILILVPFAVVFLAGLPFWIPIIAFGAIYFIFLAGRRRR